MQKSEFRFLKRSRRERYRQWAKDYVHSAGGISGFAQHEVDQRDRVFIKEYVQQRVGFLEAILVSVIVKLVIHFINEWAKQYSKHPSLCTMNQSTLQPGEPTYSDK